MVNFFPVFIYRREVIVYTSGGLSPNNREGTHEEIIFLLSPYPSAFIFPSFFYFSASAHKCTPF